MRNANTDSTFDPEGHGEPRKPFRSHIALLQSREGMERMKGDEGLEKAVVVGMVEGGLRQQMKDRIRELTDWRERRGRRRTLREVNRGGKCNN